MKLREILDTVQKIYPFDKIDIEYLTYDPYGEDTCFGYCDAKKDGDTYIITPHDGDSYSLDDELVKYEIFTDECDDTLICVWFEGEWI